MIKRIFKYLKDALDGIFYINNDLWNYYYFDRHIEDYIKKMKDIENESRKTKP